MKNGKKLLGFSFYIHIENFEVFLWVKKLSANLFFLKNKSDIYGDSLTYSFLFFYFWSCSFDYFYDTLDNLQSLWKGHY